MFQKRIGDVEPEDIQKLVDEQLPESFDLEFKATIPTETGEPDRWITKGDRVGRGGAKILREIVAFANAHGGTLVLGIDETEDDPKRAAKVMPLPRCKELAERFSAIMRDDIEPRLSFVECRGVVMLPDGSGVVIIRAPASKLGPHWVASARDAPIRRGAHSVSMTMSEIQDLTLKLSRDAYAIEREFDRRADNFSARFDSDRYRLERSLQSRLPAGMIACAKGVGLVAMPLAPIVVPNIIGDTSLRPGASLLDGIGNLDGTRLGAPAHFDDAAWRPILRGIRYELMIYEFLHWREISERGTIEMAWIDADNSVANAACRFPLDRTLWSVAFVLLWIERLRTRIGAPDLPFGLSMIMRCGSDTFAPVLTPLPITHVGHLNRFPPSVRLPNYRIAARESFEPLLREIADDFFNAGGAEFKATFDLSLKGALDQIDKRP